MAPAGSIREPILAVDVGRGTQDILYYLPDRPMENCPRMVFPSPTVIRAAEIGRATERGEAIALTGVCMGGGPISRAVRRHLAEGLAVYATPDAAMTLSDNPGRVRAMGVVITREPPDDAVTIRTGDLMLNEISSALQAVGLHLPTRIAVAVQDHGFAPDASNRWYRFQLMRRWLEDAGWDLTSWLQDPPPPELTRMGAVRRICPGALVVDTGPAAVMGTLCDPHVRKLAEVGVCLVNAGNGHTIAFTIRESEICGVFEHHTAMLDPGRLQEWLDRLMEGTITFRDVFGDGGHGAAINRPLPGATLIATGPNRRRLLPQAYQAAPFGDMMLTGCFGLLAIWRALRC
ncbi:MAG: DUF1786 domain-containing protein [Methanoculleaceae archaeon]